MSFYDGKIEPLPTQKKTLTEQWREGTLPEGCYYILYKNGHVKTERTCFYSYTDEQCFCFTSNKDIEEVLAPVPSYDECNELVRKSDKLDKIMSDTVTNQGDCQQIVEDNLKRRIKLLEKKLKIATRALKEINKNYRFTVAQDVVYKALKEMEGVK